MKFNIKRPDPIPLTRETYQKLKTDLIKFEEEDAQILVRLQAAREMGGVYVGE